MPMNGFLRKWFPDLRSSDDRALVADTAARLHFGRLRVAVAVLIPLGIFFLGTDAMALRSGRELAISRWYLGLDAAFLLGHLLMLVILMTWRPSADGTRRAPRGMVYAYSQLILAWAALVTAFELQATGATTTIIIAMMAVSMLALLSFRAVCLLMVSSIAIFFLAASFLPGSTPPPFERVMFAVGLVAVCLVVSRSLFTALAERVIAHDRLARANAQLHTVQMGLIQKEKFATIGQLSAGIAHEINNPLGYLKSNFSTLEQNFRHIVERTGPAREDPAYAHFLSGMEELFQDTRDGFRHIGEVIDNLRLFSHTPPSDYYGSYDLVQGIENTLVVARSAYASVAGIERDLRPLPEIEARGSEINQVLLNLLMNAVDAVRSAPDAGEGLIRFSCRSDGVSVRCDISDSGPGVPRELRPRIFDPFFTTKPAGEGLGLGLSLSYEIIVHRHHGTLQLLDGTPTTFRVQLPVLQPARTEPAGWVRVQEEGR